MDVKTCYQCSKYVKKGQMKYCRRFTFQLINLDERLDSLDKKNCMSFKAEIDEDELIPEVNLLKKTGYPKIDALMERTNEWIEKNYGYKCKKTFDTRESRPETTFGNFKKQLNDEMFA